MPASRSAIGGPAAVVTADHFSKDAAVGVLRKGGSAVDAMIAAAAVQCVVANGPTTVAGMWISNSYDAASGQTTTVSSKIGPAEAESYDFDMDSPEGYGGRTMPVPGWVAGAYRAWEQGGRLGWPELFEHAIALADGYDCDPATYLRVRNSLVAARTAEGREIWMRDGRYLDVGERVEQPALARTFRSLAEGGPAAFYEGEFAQHYVAKSQQLGGRLTMADMARWPDNPVVRPSPLLGDYQGSQIVTEGGLMVYALHLAQAADIGALDDAEAVYAQVRIMEEVLHATQRYSPATRDQFADRAYADGKINEVLTRPVRPASFELFWANTRVLSVRDGDGNLAWVVHSINTSSVFGAGILVDGAYAVRAISENHARTGDLLQPGMFTNLALFRDGKPYAVCGSPGFGAMHAPIGFMIGLVQRKLDPLAAVSAPRFGLPSPLTADRQPFESHYPPAVFTMLSDRGVPYFECSPSGHTGFLGAIVVEDGVVHAVQDMHGDGGAAAFAP